MQPQTQNEFMLPDGITFPDLQAVPKPVNDPIPAQNLAQLIHRQALIAAENDEQGLFDFAKTDAYTVWSGVVTSDSMVALGYAPEGTTTIDWAAYDPQNYDWQYARAYTLAYILRELTTAYPDRQFSAANLIYQEAEYLPILYLRLSDYDLISKLQQLPTVQYVEPAGVQIDKYIADTQRSSGCGETTSDIQTIDYTTVTPNSKVSWHLGPTGHLVSLAWNNAPGGNGISIGLIDTGIETDNQQLNMPVFASGNSAGRNVLKINKFRVQQEGNNADDQCGHGTRMAGILVHPRNNDGSITGVAFRSNLVAYRIGNGTVIDGINERAAIVDALSDAGNRNDIRVISFSLGSAGLVQNDVKQAIEFAYSKGKLIFAAAGSIGNIPVFPARTCLVETIAVTALQRTSDRTALVKRPNSAIGAFVDFGTFMEDVLPTRSRFALTTRQVQGDQLAKSVQTSGATATCAGIAALVWSVNPYLTRDQVQDILRQSASMGNNRNANFGWGVIDASMAVNLAAGTTAPPSSVFFSINGPTIITTSGTYDWTVQTNSAIPLTFSWNGGPGALNNTTYTQFVTVPNSGSFTIPITLTSTETAGAGRTFTNSLSVIVTSDPNGELPE